MPITRHSGSLISRGLIAVSSLLALAAVPARVQAQCELNSPTGRVEHVFYLQFDNVHFSRDNPNVPSDLEQMPNLLNFIKKKGRSTPAITRF